jgi:hypothetical protein
VGLDLESNADSNTLWSPETRAWRHDGNFNSGSKSRALWTWAFPQWLKITMACLSPTPDLSPEKGRSGCRLIPPRMLVPSPPTRQNPEAYTPAVINFYVANVSRAPVSARAKRCVHVCNKACFWASYTNSHSSLGFIVQYASLCLSAMTVRRVKLSEMHGSGNETEFGDGANTLKKLG